MLKSVKFWGVVVGAGTVIGLSIVGWLYTNRSDTSAAVAPPGYENEPSLASPAAVGVIPLNTSNTASPSATPGLAVTGDGNQGSMLGASTQSQSATPTPSSDQLPGPSDFAQYNQYASNSTALYEDVKVGTGSAVASGSKLTVAYSGWLTDGTEFDCTLGSDYACPKKGAAPGFTFTEGQNQVIPGWEEGLYGMKAGGERRVIIPPSQAYGNSPPAGSGIPADAVLVFDVTLLSLN